MNQSLGAVGINSEPAQSFDFPPSFAQQRLWVIDQLAQGTAAYNIPQAHRLRGPLSVPALKTALEGLVERHESLRTTFDTDSGTLYQVIHSKRPPVLAIHDLQAFDKDTVETEQARLLRAEADRPFDLENGPLFRCCLIRLGAHEHILVLNAHHIVFDGWSAKVLEHDLSALYNAALSGRTASLQALPIQYADFAVWQRDWLDGDRTENQMRYWRTALEELTVLQLPTDYPRPAVQTFNGATVRIEIPSLTLDGLRAACQQFGVTLFMALLAAFHVLLARYSGQSDIAVGAPFAGRNRPDVEDMIGLFVNSLVLRAQFTQDLEFSELLKQIRDSVLGALSHQDIPFEKLVAELLPARETDRNPLFQVMFALHDEDGGALSFSGIDVERIPVPMTTAKVDLALFVKESRNALVCSLNYNTDLYCAATAESMLRHFGTLLDDIAINPQKKISSLRLLDTIERQRLFESWNDTTTPYPRDSCVHHLFEQQVQRNPEAVALIYREQHLTYRELNARADQLAHRLEDLGVVPGTLIGVCAERSVEMVVALLGILKAGGAYVPLDPAYPDDRLRYILSDTNADLVLTVRVLRQRMLALAQAVILLDDMAPTDAGVARERREVNAEDPAYVMYTSGSTGQPKGIVIPHRAILRLVFGIDYARLDADQSILQLASISFDASTFEIWGALLHGGRLILAPPGPPDFDTLAQLIERHHVSTLWLTAALFNRLVETRPDALRGVQQILTGGEVLSVPHVRLALRQLEQDATLINCYGPTECTTFACCYPIPRELDPDITSIPIGRPIANTQAYVLGGNLSELPVGVTGELYLGGDGVARGYLNRFELTAEKFVPNPFTCGETLYRTGDLARFLPTGEIEFVGRIDDQVKIRGYRVEPGEIEAQILRYDAVESCIVVAEGKAGNEKRLVACVVPKNIASFKSADLREFLQRSLPEFMLPAAVVPLSDWPLNNNGKIDRAALIKPSVEAQQVTASKLPSTQTELHLCKIWEELLGVARVGTTDNFFELGGHSLLAVNLFDAIERQFGARLPMDALWYKGATIETLGQLLEQYEHAIKWPALVEMQPKGIRRPLFFVHTMGGNLFHYDDLVAELGTDQPVYGLQARGVYGSDTPRTTLAHIAADAIEAIKTRQPSGPYLIVGFSSGGVVAYEIAQQLRSQGDRIERLIMIDTYMPATGKLARLKSRLAGVSRARSIREFQERLYHLVLHSLGLDRYRKLQKIGEAHRWAHWSYAPRCYPGRVDLIVARDQKTSPTPTLRYLAAESLRVATVPGAHGTMVRHPHVKELARQLNRIILHDAAASGE
jgi:aspartate racemase